MNTMNEHTTQFSTITKNVLAKIQKGEVSMRAKWQFALRLALLVALVALILIVASFLVSFIIFGSKVSGHLILLGFGTQGVLTFFALFPWKLLIVTVLLFVALELLLKRFKWGYRNSFLYVFSIVSVISIAVGATITATPLHLALLEKADQDDLPVFRGAYESLHEHSREHEHGIFKGTITSVSDGGFMLVHDDVDSDADDGVIRVMLAGDAGNGVFLPGDTVLVAGESDSFGTIRAYGVREVDLSALK